VDSVQVDAIAIWIAVLFGLVERLTTTKQVILVSGWHAFSLLQM
jgi:hypothetical protein